MSDKLSVELSKRQTNRKEAEKVKENLKNLLKKGAKGSILDIRYVKLAEYENREEDLGRLYSEKYDENDENYE